MTLFTSPNNLVLWQDVVKHASNRCDVNLQQELEIYLSILLARYTNKPEVAKKILAQAFLEALQKRAQQREISMQDVGDQCLLFAGLFPRSAEKKHVKISYFVEMGRTAYLSISKVTNDLYDTLALHFVVLMDVLQSIGPTPLLLPLEAYDQWHEVGSQRALKILQEYTRQTPHKNNNH